MISTVGFSGATQKSLLLGDHLYKVSIDPFAFGWREVIGNTFHSTVSPYQSVPINVQVSTVPQPSTLAVPEPSTLALLATGLAGLGALLATSPRSPRRATGAHAGRQRGWRQHAGETFGPFEFFETLKPFVPRHRYPTHLVRRPA